MTRDEIIKLAREAGGVPAGGGTFIAGTIDWERFAALVAAAEREACAKVCEQVGIDGCCPTADEFASAIRARSTA